MKKFGSIVALLVMLFCVSIAWAAPDISTGYLTYDKGRAAIQGFAPVPSMAQVPVTINAAATATKSVVGMVAVQFRATGDVRVYMNTDTTKYLTYEGLIQHTLVINPATTSLKFVNNGASAITLELWGM